jgi:hypothetical protein
VLHVRADHPHDAFAADNLAVLADPPDACSNLHNDTLFQQIDPSKRVESEIIVEKFGFLNALESSHA